MVNFVYRPLPERVTVKKSEIDGLGVFSVKEIRAGMRLGKTHYMVGNELERTPLGGFINHNDNPNGFIHPNDKELWTIRPIKAGEEITVYYTINQNDEI